MQTIQRRELGRILALSTEERSADVPRMPYLFPKLVSNCPTGLALTQRNSRLIQPPYVQRRLRFRIEGIRQWWCLAARLPGFEKGLHSMTAQREFRTGLIRHRWQATPTMTTTGNITSVTPHNKLNSSYHNV